MKMRTLTEKQKEYWLRQHEITDRARDTTKEKHTKTYCKARKALADECGSKDESWISHDRIIERMIYDNPKLAGKSYLKDDTIFYSNRGMPVNVKRAVVKPMSIFARIKQWFDCRCMNYVLRNVYDY
jgi:hypothetical protein